MKKSPKKGGPKQTRVPFRTSPPPAHEMQGMIREFSICHAEQIHVETLEEANDFNIGDDDDEDFFKNQTVYEMHDQAEENLALFQSNFPPEQETQAESNETEAGAIEDHDQSAPGQPNPPAEQPLVQTNQ